MRFKANAERFKGLDSDNRPTLIFCRSFLTSFGGISDEGGAEPDLETSKGWCFTPGRGAGFEVPIKQALNRIFNVF